MGRRGERKAWRMILMLVFVLVVGVAASGDDDDDEEEEGTTRAAFEVDGEVRHDWGQNNLREWDGHVRAAPAAHCARTRCYAPCSAGAPARSPSELVLSVLRLPLGLCKLTLQSKSTQCCSSD